MLDPYRLFAVNIALFVILVSTFLFNYYVFPKKKISPLILVIILSILPVISIFRIGVYESGDFGINVIKSMAMWQSLTDLHIPVHWSENLNATYGYPNFLFAYPLPYYLINFLHLLGFSFIWSLKWFLVLAYIASGISMYALGKELWNRNIGFLCAVFYLYAPYHLINLHFRVDIGEVLTYAIMPLIVLFYYKLKNTKEYKWLAFLSLSITSLILSHQAVSLVFIGFFAFLAIFDIIISKKKTYLPFLAIFLGLLLSSFYWLPVIVETHYTLQPYFTNTLRLGSISDFLISPYRFGFLFQGNEGQLATIVGYPQTGIILFFCILVFLGKIKTIKQLAFVLALSFLILFFLLTDYSRPLWYTIPLIKNFQFSSRLLTVIDFITALSVGFIASYYKNKVFWFILIALTIGATILNWGNRRVIPTITDQILASRIPQSTYEGEGLQPAVPMWVDRNNIWMKDRPSDHLEVINGSGTITQLNRSVTSHEYVINLTQESTLRENTLYFPGWKLYINNTEHQMNYKETKGIIHFTLPEGSYYAKLIFTKTPIRTIGIALSLSTFCVLLLFPLSKALDKRR